MFHLYDITTLNADDQAWINSEKYLKRYKDFSSCSYASINDKKPVSKAIKLKSVEDG